MLSNNALFGQSTSSRVTSFKPLKHVFKYFKRSYSHTWYRMSLLHAVKTLTLFSGSSYVVCSK